MQKEKVESKLKLEASPNEYKLHPWKLKDGENIGSKTNVTVLMGKMSSQFVVIVL